MRSLLRNVTRRTLSTSRNPPPPPPPPRKPKPSKPGISSKEEMMALLKDAKPKKRRPPPHTPATTTSTTTTTTHQTTPSVSSTSASVPLMITKQMRVRLKEDANLNDAAIRKLTPQEAHDVLAKTTPKSTSFKTTAAASSSSTTSATTATTATATTATTATTGASSTTASNAPPTSMAGPAFGGIFGGCLAFGGAGYYFFGGDEDDDSSPLNMVVKMVRGNKDEEHSSDSSSAEMSLEEYEKLQAANQQSFSKTLEEVKGLAQKSSTVEAEGENLLSSSDAATADKDLVPNLNYGQPKVKRELTMLEKLEQAKRRGNTAGISSQKLKRMAPQKPAWMVEDEKKQRTTGNMEKDPLEPVKPAWMENNGNQDDRRTAAPSSSASSVSASPTSTSSTTSNTSTSTTSSSRPTTVQSSASSPTLERTQEEKLLAGLMRMLTNQREREQEYKNLHNIGQSSSFFARRAQVEDPRHTAILQGFKDEKARIKQNMKEIKSKKS